MPVFFSSPRSFAGLKIFFMTVGDGSSELTGLGNIPPSWREAHRMRRSVRRSGIFVPIAAPCFGCGITIGRSSFILLLRPLTRNCRSLMRWSASWRALSRLGCDGQRGRSRYLMVIQSIAWKTGTRSTNCSSNRWDALGDDDTKLYEMWTMFYRKVGALFESWTHYHYH